jgi:hypothetical protein
VSTLARIVAVLSLCVASVCLDAAALTKITGRVTDPQGTAVANAHLRLSDANGSPIQETSTDSEGRFTFADIAPGHYRVSAEVSSFAPVASDITISSAQSNAEITLQFREVASLRQAVTVTGSSAPSALTPDPAEHVVVHDQVLDANPGRPGVPVSIPGLPVETASGGIKAPQYFAPGVAGDHGEPIAQFYQIGDFLYPNNLPANAHGNGYSDPNFLIAPIVEAVAVDGGAFNVREGNHSVDLAATYIPRRRLDTFAQLTFDDRDIDLVAGWSPRNPDTNAFVSVEASYGNGYLERLEHRQQYKINAFRAFNLGRHELTLFGVGYYGFSYSPGLIPIDTTVPNDTVDNRQLDRTHTSIFVASDTWRISDNAQLTTSAFFRTYSLTLRSNFEPDFTQSLTAPGGLIQQSEFRTVAGGGALYAQKFRSWLSVLAGLDLRRDAPRDLDLHRLDSAGVFEPVTSNNLTLSFVEPYVALDGALSRYFHYDVGLRREEVWIDNQDVLAPQNSFDHLAAVSLPKPRSLSFRPLPFRHFFPRSRSATAKPSTRKTRASVPPIPPIPHSSRPLTPISSFSTSRSKKSISKSRCVTPPTPRNSRRSIPTPASRKTKARRSIDRSPFPCSAISITDRSSLPTRKPTHAIASPARPFPKRLAISGTPSAPTTIFHSACNRAPNSNTLPQNPSATVSPAPA